MTGGPARYTFKSALLRRPASYALDGGLLLSDDGWELGLAEVTAAAFVNHVMRGARLMRLDLRVGGSLRSLSYTGAATGWRDDPDAAEFLRLVRDVLDRLASTAPRLEVTLGERGGGRIAMFAIGVVSAVAGIGAFIAALATGISTDRLAAASVPMLLLSVLGALLTYSYGPWRKPPGATPAAVARAIGEIIEGLGASGGKG